MSALSEFLYMDGKGVYIWSGYGIALVVLIANVILARREKKQAQKNVMRQLARNDSRATRSATTLSDAELKQ